MRFRPLLVAALAIALPGCGLSPAGEAERYVRGTLPTYVSDPFSDVESAHAEADPSGHGFVVTGKIRRYEDKAEHPYSIAVEHRPDGSWAMGSYSSQ